jgi:NADPH:quinone reductase
VTGLNRQIRLAARPVGMPRLSDFHLAYAPVPSVGPGQVLVRSQYLALDPHLRPRMSATCVDGPPLALGAVIAGSAVGRVTRSEDPAFSIGDAVEGLIGWQEHAVIGASELRKVDPGAGLTTALGVLGLPGLTAYFGLLEVGQPQRGETVVVSGASGAIGMVAGQIARLAGCRVVGLANGDGDASWLRDELGFDAVVTGETASDPNGELAKHCPDGVDIYFDTVGGAASDEVLGRVNPRARVALCGQSSQDNLEQPELGPRWLGRLIAREARAQGFRVVSWRERFSVGLAQLAAWLDRGSLRYREEVVSGLDAAPQAFIAMLQGQSQGHQLVRLV